MMAPNYPSSRQYSAVSISSSTGLVYLYGGYFINQLGELGTLSDLWSLNLTCLTGETYVPPSVPTTTGTPSGSTTSGSGTTSGGGAVSTTASEPTASTTSEVASNADQSKSSSKDNFTIILAASVGGGGGVIIFALIIIFLIARQKYKSRGDVELVEVEDEPGRKRTIRVVKRKTTYGNLDSVTVSPANSSATSPMINRNSTRASVRMNVAVPSDEKGIKLSDYQKFPLIKPKVIDVASNVNDKDFVVPFSELELGRELGRGAFGVVFQGIWRGGTVAVKQILTEGPIGQKEIDEFKAEAALMIKIRPHVNIVQFLGVTVNPDPMCIITEFLSEGSLQSYLHSDTPMEVSAFQSIIMGIAGGMLHLHKEGVVHRDLASRNVLMSPGFKVKISDFGMSRKMSKGGGNQTKTETGPLKWMAPESLLNREYSFKTDIWAFGVTLFEIVSRDEPYPGLLPVEAALKVMEEGYRLEPPPHCPVGIAEVMRACMSVNPEERPDFEQISNFLRDVPETHWLFVQ